MTKPWDDMTPRERDTALAQALGYTIYHYDKDYRENCYYMLMDPNGDPVIAGRSGERKTEAGAWDDAPNFTTDYDDCRLVEDEIEHRNLQDRYAEALFCLVNDKALFTVVEWWNLIRATPEERCRAALEVLS